MSLNHPNPITDTSGKFPGDASVPFLTPVLQNGDRLNRIEFERRYHAMPGVNKAELVEGVVYMPSPVSAEKHGEPHSDLIGILFLYRAHTPGVRSGDNSSLRLDLDNMPQPDGYLRLEPECGGMSKIVDGMLEGAPELIAEVAASSVSYDLHDKFRAYRRNGVQEYLVWRVVDKAIDWFSLVDGEYRQLEQSPDGTCRSQIFPGLWLDVAAVLSGDAARVVQTLQQGLATRDHADFVQRIQQSKESC